MNAVQRSAVVLRRRSNWEAADMGVLLWRKNLPPLLAFFGLPAAVFYAACAFLPEEFAGLGVIALWWLKPFFDRFALHVVSVRFFESGAKTGRLFRGLGKDLFRALSGDLLWRRFSPFRASRMPLYVLEGLKKKARAGRRALLTPRGLDFCLPLTVICMGISAVLYIGELFFIYAVFDLIQPDYLDDIWYSIGGAGPLGLALSWFNLIIIETLFVCMGFGLYINARVETEGWDIELLFKKCAEKAGRKTFWRERGALPAAAFCLFLFAAPLRLPAAETAQTIENYELPRISEGSQKALDEIFASPDFGREKQVKRIRFKETEETGEEKKLPFDIEWRKFDFPRVKEIAGIVLRTLLILAVIFTAFWSARYLLRRRAAPVPKAESAKSRLAENAAPDSRSLLAQAAAAREAGEIRESWALCYRAFTAAIASRFSIFFPPGCTEYEALARSRGSGGPEFSRFVGRWIRFAYGGGVPEEGAFEEAYATRHAKNSARRRGGEKLADCSNRRRRAGHCRGVLYTAS